MTLLLLYPGVGTAAAAAAPVFRERLIGRRIAYGIFRGFLLGWVLLGL